jgi:hypothetical protein
MKQRPCGLIAVPELTPTSLTGSGIFVTPALIVLRGIGSVAASLLLWTAGSIIATAGLLVWLEFGLSIPRQPIPAVGKRSVPRSGGEKNYVRHFDQTLMAQWN